MPDVGESVTEGTVVRWLKREGEEVTLDEPIVEIETEKVEVEVPSPFEGRLIRILVAEGAVAPVGAPLAEFEAGDAAKEPASPADGREASAAADSAIVRAPVTAAERSVRTRRYSPVVLKLAEEHGIDLALVQGTGIEGRVTRRDVVNYVENPVAHTVPPSAEAGVVGVASGGGRAPEADGEETIERRPAPALATETGNGELVALTATRRTIAARMLESHRSVPVAWMAIEADVTEMVTLRNAAKDGFGRVEGVALTYLPFFVQAIVGALKEHTALNATFSDEGIRRHAAYHIGIAVAAPAGLIVPVIRDADRKSIAGIARELDELGAKARERRLGIDDVRGATFTIDNTGAFGSVVSQPIVPPGQVAIITTEAIRRELRVAADGSFAARSVMNLCLSFDHRALDGAEAGAFMQAVKGNLESLRHDQPVY
ncbi:MAG TPA: dihydrolipoamide acetyltransferase family protein [Dehalococcoidia bacterium]|nr:dihydrolipoamide acetyltransferase family protein [Dehalococcoidia bacterium]